MLGPAVAASPIQPVRLDTQEPNEGKLKTLFGLDAESLAARLQQIGEPAWRGRQLAQALYREWVATLDAVTPFPKKLRQKMVDTGWTVGLPCIEQAFVSNDGTERYLVGGQMGDGQTVEAVWMPEGDGGEAGDEGEAGLTDVPPKAWDRATICISSQAGCAVNCKFCLTAKLGLQRNLSPGEIAGQVVAVLARNRVEVGKDRVNLVFMGMGEPLLNYDNWMAAVRILVNEVRISPQRMTVSTSGIVPGVERLAGESPDVRPKLAISLNAPNDAIRTEVMPVNRKWPIDAIISAVRKIQLRPRERITFEYVLLGGVTDRPDHATELAHLVRRVGLPAKVNLIAWNPGPEVPYSTPDPGSVEAFRRALVAADVPAYLRRPRGRDIFAACGQLKRTVETTSSANR